MDIQVKNCNSIHQGEINIVEKALNIKYAINGTGKSTLAKAISAGIKGDEKALQSLKPYYFLDKSAAEYEPQVDGMDTLHSVMMFDEKYVNDFVFQPDELIKDSFSIFVKTPDYDSHMQEIGALLKQINDSFRTHPELDELIKVLGQFIDAFGKSKAGVSKASPLYKSLGEGNKIQNVPLGLEDYSPYLTHADDAQNVKWIKWQLQGEPFLSIADQCPYCTASIETSKEKILQVKTEYDSKSVEHLNNMLQIFDILRPYFSNNTTKEINDITNNISGITKQQQDYLGEIRKQAESLLDALRTLKGIGFHSLKETEKIADEIKGYTINVSYYSHFQSDATREKIDVINHSLDEVLMKAGILQGEINQQKILIQKTVEQNSERINGFLKSAGYQYEVLLEEDKTNQFRLLLKPVNCGIKVNQVKEHLSFGERNAFALVLFMFSALRENPDLVILDDPISSFDGNKKFAILNMLFLAKGAFGMPKMKPEIPQYSTCVRKGIEYYRTRIVDADGKRVSLYARTPEELYAKVQEAEELIEDSIFRSTTPTVDEYCEKWLKIQKGRLRSTTYIDYEWKVRKFIQKPLGKKFMEDVTPDDVNLALLPVLNMSHSVYRSTQMLFKLIFTAAVDSRVIAESPCKKISAKGGKPQKEKLALTDEQVDKLIASIKGLPPYVFVMIGLYCGLRREEILGLMWDCVHLEGNTPYLSVRRAWHTEHNRPVILEELKTKAAKRDVPIPTPLAECLKEAKANSKSSYVVANSEGKPLSYAQFQRIWKYIETRSTKERKYVRYVNGQKVTHTVKPVLGEKAAHNGNVVYSLDFQVTPHQLRHTYITNLIYAGVDPKTVQYLAGHENSKITMDIYAKVKYNNPDELSSVVNSALSKRYVHN